MIRSIFPCFLIAVAVILRLIPHPPNFTPLTAVALYGAVYLDKRFAVIVPLAAMALSDVFLGFHPGVAWVYGSFIAIAVLGLWLRRHRKLVTTAAVTVASSTLFFLVTNFGVWMGSHTLYPHTPAGLLECYLAALPFFRNAILGDVCYVMIMFGSHEFARRVVPSLSAVG